MEVALVFLVLIASETRHVGRIPRQLLQSLSSNYTDDDDSLLIVNDSMTDDR